ATVFGVSASNSCAVNRPSLVVKCARIMAVAYKNRRHLMKGLLTTAVLALPAVAFAQAGGAPGAAVGPSKAELRNPSALNEKAPDTYKAKFDTSKGPFVIEVHRDWAPLGADRFYNLVKNGYYDDCRFFRVIDGFMAQIGMNGNPAIQQAWTSAR